MDEKENNRSYGYRLRMSNEENNKLNSLSNHFNIKKSELLRLLINDEYNKIFVNDTTFDEENGYPNTEDIDNTLNDYDVDEENGYPNYDFEEYYSDAEE